MRRFARGVLAALALALVATGALAQAAAPPPVVIIVDMTQIMRESKAAKSIQAQVEREMNAYSKDVAQKEDGLKNLRDELERQRTVLAPDIFNAKSQDYQQRYSALDREVQAKRQEMQQGYSEAMTKVESLALQLIADLAKERKANLVVAKAALLYMDDALDVTAEVTRRLDEKLPTASVSPPKDSDAAAKSKPAAAAKK